LSVDDHTQLFGGSQGKLLLVADGMGGHAAGERASRLAVDNLANYVLNSLSWLFRLQQDAEEDFIEELIRALQKCQRAVLTESERMPARRGMGTTLTMAYVIWPRAYIVHVGDSRCYLLHDSDMRQITKDHTLAQQFVDHGALKPEEAENSKWSHMVWNVLGGINDELTPQVTKLRLQIGDSLLLCTDGLNKHVADSEILRLMSQDVASDEICSSLVNSANSAGGSDNITVVIAKFNQQQSARAAQTATTKFIPADDPVETTCSAGGQLSIHDGKSDPSGFP